MSRNQKQPAAAGEPVPAYASPAQPSPVELLSSEYASIQQHFLFRLHRLGRQMVRAIAARPQPSGLSFSERGMLMTIGGFSPLTLREVAEHAEVDKGQASRLVSSLVAQGLVRKTAHERDGRGIQLSLTAKGRDLHAALRAEARELNEQVLVALTAAERVTLERLLTKLESRAEALAAAAAGPVGPPVRGRTAGPGTHASSSVAVWKQYYASGLSLGEGTMFGRVAGQLVAAAKPA